MKPIYNVILNLQIARKEILKAFEDTNNDQLAKIKSEIVFNHLTSSHVGLHENKVFCHQYGQVKTKNYQNSAFCNSFSNLNALEITFNRTIS